jgi:hypothetical protein
VSAGNLEVIACIIQPYFDAVRYKFASFKPEPSVALSKLSKVGFLIEPAVHNTPRHFAACRDDGGLILLAPEFADLSEENVIAMLAHEFGHAADFAYPGNWVTSDDPTKAAVWIGNRNDKQAMRWRKFWMGRNTDQQEMAADSIVKTITGKTVGYCGDLTIQCFTGKPRPVGLR